MFLKSHRIRASIRANKSWPSRHYTTSSHFPRPGLLFPTLQVQQPLSLATSPPTLAQSTSTNKISSRTQQIARHLSSSSSSFSPNNNSRSANMAPQYNVRKIGAPNTLEHRIYIEKDGVPVSPFHDIPLYANEAQTVLNMVVEIPRWTNAKLEVRPDPSSFSACYSVVIYPAIVSST